MNTDPLTSQIIGSALQYASEEMGLALRNAAYSPNVRERMDHSAALFTADGKLLAQAEHIPVHLGSLPWGLRNLISRCESDGLAFDRGCMIASNDPYLTGTHLNDVTVLSPIHYNRRLVAFAANKAHHADVGGLVPGSISMKARTLAEEGYVLEPSYLQKGRRFVTSTVDDFAKGSRSPKERRGDLMAQAAANTTGERKVLGLIERYGIEAFLASADDSFEHSDSMMRSRLSRLAQGTFSASDTLEGPDSEDLKIHVNVKVDDEGVDVDYAGTDHQVDYPLNAVFGVTISGAYFVMRCLTGSDIPANHGAFRRIRIRAPVGSLLNPTRPHPVGAGNVETSQRNADVLFKALSEALQGVPAAAGGSMNNVMMGGPWRGGWSFYETIGVGLGGSHDSDGVDGIQANMTNTMNTPIEEIERSFPLLVTRYELRPDSSGAGRSRGGCGLVRAFKSVADGTVLTIAADRERHPPWGLHGGQGGGETRVYLRRGMKERRLPTKTTRTLKKGDEVTIMTAGGGGYGRPGLRPRDKVLADVQNGLLTEGRAKRDYSLLKRRG